MTNDAKIRIVFYWTSDCYYVKYNLKKEDSIVIIARRDKPLKLLWLEALMRRLLRVMLNSIIFKSNIDD